VSLPLLLIASVCQEIFFRGVMNELVGVLLSTTLFTFWNFFPNRKKILVSIFFFFLAMVQSQIYFYTKNIVYVVYTNFLFHALIRMLKYKI
jgi:membrane protease YdiL (CAAX protease family)